MGIFDRIIYSVIGAISGALLGVVCWWLYGLAHSLNYQGVAMDPVLRHWVIWVGALFALLGAVLRDELGSFVGDALSGILHFEVNDAPTERGASFAALVFLVICLAAIWFTVPIHEAAR